MKRLFALLFVSCLILGGNLAQADKPLGSDADAVDDGDIIGIPEIKNPPDLDLVDPVDGPGNPNCYAGEGPHTLHVMTRDVDGNPVAGARVVVISGSYRGTGVTDGFGHAPVFMSNGLRAGGVVASGGILFGTGAYNFCGGSSAVILMM